MPSSVAQREARFTTAALRDVRTSVDLLYGLEEKAHSALSFFCHRGLYRSRHLEKNHKANFRQRGFTANAIRACATGKCCATTEDLWSRWVSEGLMLS